MTDDFCVVLSPRLIDMGKVHQQSNLENLEQAFGVAERDLGVTRLLDPEGTTTGPFACTLIQTPKCPNHSFFTLWSPLDVDVPHPDEKSIITYVSSLYDAMPRSDAHDGARVSVSDARSRFPRLDP